MSAEGKPPLARRKLGEVRQHQTMLDMNLQAAHKRWMGSDQVEDERVMKEVTAVETKELSSVILFGKGEVAINILRGHLKREGRLETPCALELVQMAADVLRKEPNVVQLKPDLSGSFLFFSFLLFSFSSGPH